MELTDKFEDFQKYIYIQNIPILGITFYQFIISNKLKVLDRGGECLVFVDRHKKYCYKVYNFEEYLFTYSSDFNYLVLFNNINNKNLIINDISQYTLIGITADYRYIIYKQLYVKKCEDLIKFQLLADKCNIYFNVKLFNYKNIQSDSWKYNINYKSYNISDISKDNITLYNNELFFYDLDINQTKIIYSI